MSSFLILSTLVTPKETLARLLSATSSSLLSFPQCHSLKTIVAPLFSAPILVYLVELLLRITPDLPVGWNAAWMKCNIPDVTP